MEHGQGGWGVNATSLCAFILVLGGRREEEEAEADLPPNNTLAPGACEFVLRKYICGLCEAESRRDGINRVSLWGERW